MTLWLLRHAQPLVAQGVCYGVSDLAADPLATHQAAQALAQVVPSGVCMVVSPLRRCVQLAQALTALRCDLSYGFDDRLKELDFGCWEGKRWDAIPKPAYDQWMGDFAHHRFGGRESVSELLQRVAQLWDEARASEVVWITHAGVIRAADLLAQQVRQIDQASQWPLEAPGFGQWRVLHR